MDEFQVTEEKQREQIAREEARMNRLITSSDEGDVSGGGAAGGGGMSGSGDNLTPEQREMARLNKHWLAEAPKVTAGLPQAPHEKDSPKKTDNDSPRKGGITITRPSFAPKGSAAKALEISGETESQMLERRLREAKAKVYRKQKEEDKQSAWKEKEKEHARQVELQIQAKKQHDQEERSKAYQIAEERRERERHEQEERAKHEMNRALNDSDPSVNHSGSLPTSATSWGTSGEFDVQLTPEEQADAARKEEARMKTHWL